MAQVNPEGTEGRETPPPPPTADGGGPSSQRERDDRGRRENAVQHHRKKGEGRRVRRDRLGRSNTDRRR